MRLSNVWLAALLAAGIGCKSRPTPIPDEAVAPPKAAPAAAPEIVAVGAAIEAFGAT